MLKNGRIRQEIVKLYSLFTITYEIINKSSLWKLRIRSCQIRDRRKSRSAYGSRTCNCVPPYLRFHSPSSSLRTRGPSRSPMFSALWIREGVNDGNGVGPRRIRAQIRVEPVIQIDRLG